MTSGLLGYRTRRTAEHGKSAMAENQTMNERKPICYAPFIGLHATPYGEMAPCCISRKFNFSDPAEYWNSAELGSFREQMLDQQWPVGCEICKNKLEAGLPNSTDSWKHAYETAGSPPLDDPQVRFLDLRTSNLCNLKCRMCGPGSSSQWNDEIRDNPDLLKWHRPIEDRIIDSIDHFIGFDLLYISLLGGEPTIDPIVFEMMQRLIDKGGKLPAIRLTTNGTNLNNRFVDMISQFDQVFITFSVDGVGPTFEYIRTNANWEKVEQNILSMIDKGLIDHLQFNTILTPYNVFTIVDLLHWYERLHARGHQFGVSFDDSESYMTSLQAVLPHHMEQQCCQVESFFASAGDKFVRDIPGITDIMLIMRSIRFDENRYNKFKQFNSELDVIRKTDISSISPYLTDYR